MRTHFNAQRSRVRQATQLQLFDIELYGLAEAITHVLERAFSGVAGNGEHALERSM